MHVNTFQIWILPQHRAHGRDHFTVTAFVRNLLDQFHIRVIFHRFAQRLAPKKLRPRAQHLLEFHNLALPANRLHQNLRRSDRPVICIGASIRDIFAAGIDLAINNNHRDFRRVQCSHAVTNPSGFIGTRHTAATPCTIKSFICCACFCTSSWAFMKVTVAPSLAASSLRLEPCSANMDRPSSSQTQFGIAWHRLLRCF